MKSIFLASRVETARPQAVAESAEKNAARPRLFQGFPCRLLRMHTGRHPVPAIVDTGCDAMAAVTFDRRAAATESHEENKAAEDGEENISHVEFLVLLLASSELGARLSVADSLFGTKIRRETGRPVPGD
jgi:hypothetical protein